jgi:peptidoglycan/LPS O-acetylase OafA/YrhL
MTISEGITEVHSSHAMLATASKTYRIPALDFTKGALVLFMVLYHWLNYFIATEGDFYRYLRFLTPSFIFISGFLISSVYLSKYEISDWQLQKRLIQRGLKILGVFIFLNITISFLVRESYSGKLLFDPLSIMNITAIYVTGNVYTAGIGKAAVFHILVPISYLLLLSAGLLTAYRFYKYIFHVVCMGFLLCVFILDLNGFESGNLDLLTMGLLGVSIGHISIETINNVARHPYMLGGAYLCYLCAITVWNVIYPLQVIGVCLSLMAIYMLGTKHAEPGKLRRHIILLGRYSLFGYLAQIAVLQVIYRGLQHIDLGASELAISLIGAVTLTMLTVEVVDRARSRSTTLDGLYTAVFA